MIADTAPQNSARTNAAAPPPRPSSPYLNTKLDVPFIGTARCRECHPDQHATYQQTAHSRSMTPVDAAREPADAIYDHDASGRRYDVYRQAGQLRHKELVPIGDAMLVVADHPLKYLVGSGRFSRTYLAESDGFFIESPLTWYATLNRWAMSPGFDRVNHQSFHRVASFDCVYCHAGTISVKPGSLERYTIHETAIGCERCHGPGALHAERHASLKETSAEVVDDTIVNPRHLPRELAEAICHQCHLESRVRVAVRGRLRGDFRPGLPWQEFYVNYTDSGDNQHMTVTGHVEQLHQSRCYQNSETLTCITCHDPHEDNVASEPVDQVSDDDGQAQTRLTRQCLQCHADESCKLDPTDRASRNRNNCVACHMPDSATDIPHIAFTHHRIGIHPPEPQFDAVPLPPVERTLRPVLELPSTFSNLERQRMLGLAYRALAHDDPGDPFRPYFMRTSISLLERVAADGMDDPAVGAALAEAAMARGDVQLTQRWSRATLKQNMLMPEDHHRALEVSAKIQLQQGDFESAATSFEQLTEVRLFPGDWFLLGMSRMRQGNLAAARTAYERVLEIDGSQPEIHEAWAQLLNLTGDTDRASEHSAIARGLRNVRAKGRSAPTLHPRATDAK